MQVINSDLIRGNIDTIILKTMENGDMYGLDIIREVENKSNGTYELKQPTLYSCLKRLENQELISSYWLDSDIGGKRHYYKLTEKGRDVVKSKQDEWSKSKLLIDNLLGDFDSSEYRLVKKDDYEKIINGKPIIQYVNNNDSNVNDFLTNFNNQKKQENSFEKNSEQNENFFTDSYMVEKGTTTNNSNKQKDFYSPVDDDFFETSMNLSEVNDKSIDDIISDEENSKSKNIINVNNEKIDDENNKDSSSKITDADNTRSNDLIIFKNNNEKNKNNSNSSSTLFAQSFKQRDLFDFARENQLQIDENEKSQSNNSNVNVTKNTYTKSPNYVSNSEIEGTIREFNNNISNLNKINSNESTFSDDSLNSSRDEDALSDEINLSETKEVQKLDTNSLDNKNDSTNKNYHTQLKDNRLLSELSNLFNNEYSNKNISFENDDGYYHSKDNKDKKDLIPNETTSQNITSNNEFSVSANLSENTTNFVNNEENKPEFKQNDNQNAIFDDGLIIRDDQKIVDKKYDAQFAPNDSIEEIIYKNISDYSTQSSQEFIENTLSRYRQNDENEYKQKLNNLSEYAKDSYEDDYETGYTRNFQSLVDDYKSQGILVKEFNKVSNLKNDKKYVMINKLKFVKSLILLFGYSFLLSAMFIVMDSTNLKDIYNFSFKYFLYGLVPFILYFFYSVSIYILNPYKKIPENHSLKLILVLSIIATIQFLTITAIFNYQMGFNSFSQVGYNHLYWIIPTLLSFAPLISTFIHYGLINSKNFNT